MHVHIFYACALIIFTIIENINVPIFSDDFSVNHIHAAFFVFVWKSVSFGYTLFHGREEKMIVIYFLCQL